MSITLEGADRTVGVEGFPTSFMPNPAAKIIVSRTRGFGIVPTSDGIAFGWVSEERVYRNQDAGQCGALFLVENRDQVEAVMKVFANVGSDISNLCVSVWGEEK